METVDAVCVVHARSVALRGMGWSRLLEPVGPCMWGKRVTGAYHNGKHHHL